MKLGDENNYSFPYYTAMFTVVVWLATVRYARDPLRRDETVLIIVALQNSLH